MELFLTYLAAVFALMIIPGPDMAYCAASGLAHGRRGAFFAATGIGTGGMMLVAVAAALIFFAHEADSRIIGGIQFLGCFYLLYLAAVVIYPRHEAESGGGIKLKETTAGQVFGRGIITNISNPKALVFILSFIPQFIPEASANPAVHVLWLGAVLCVIGTAMNFGFGLLGSTASPLNRIVILGRSLAQYILSAVFAVVAASFLLVLFYG